MEECNDLPVNVGWAYNKDAQKLWQENQETLAKIEGLFSATPVGAKAVVRAVSGGRGGRVFEVVSNPLNLKDDLLALYCSDGNLAFGYHKNGGLIAIHTS